MSEKSNCCGCGKDCHRKKLTGSPLKDIKEMKDLDKVWAIPTGNNISRYVKEKYSIFHILKVSRVYASLSAWSEDLKDQTRYSCNYDINGATQKCIQQGYGGNAGYLFFKSQEDADLHIESVRMKNSIRAFFRSFSKIDDLKLDEIKTIYEIIKEDES